MRAVTRNALLAPVCWNLPPLIRNPWLACVSSDPKVAIKKIPSAFDDVVDAKRIVREVRLLRRLDHMNIIKIVDILPPPSLTDFNDVYIVSELMDTDLHRVIYSSQVRLRSRRRRLCRFNPVLIYTLSSIRSALITMLEYNLGTPNGIQPSRPTKWTHG